MQLVPVFILAVIFGFTYAVIYLLVRKRERMALLDKGVDASAFLSPVKEQSYTALKFGLLFIGAAIGILLGSILYKFGLMGEEAAYFSMIFLFGGLGLVLDHFMEKNERKASQKKEIQ
jgi:Flp pilus assembly protein protease CpaA